MGKDLKAFQIKVNGRVLDYRLGKELDLDQVRAFFERRYLIKKLWSGGRHVLGILEKDSKELFLKLATTKGISAVTKNEYKWNEQFNKLVPRRLSNFWVPQNKDCGLYNQLFYFISDKFKGELFTPRPEKVKVSTTFLDFLPAVIEFSELIQQLSFANLSNQEDTDYRKLFLEKTKSWYGSVPKDVLEKYNVCDLLQIVEEGISGLQKRPRHGDFTPWHIIKLQNNEAPSTSRSGYLLPVLRRERNPSEAEISSHSSASLHSRFSAKGDKLGLIDGEHAMGSSVEYYDIGYFIQRVFCVLQNQDLAEKILSILVRSDYNIDKLRIILAARGIGGFLDESLKPKPNYKLGNKFKDWVMSLN